MVDCIPVNLHPSLQLRSCNTIPPAIEKAAEAAPVASWVLCKLLPKSAERAVQFAVMHAPACPLFGHRLRGDCLLALGLAVAPNGAASQANSSSQGGARPLRLLAIRKRVPEVTTAGVHPTRAARLLLYRTVQQKVGLEPDSNQGLRFARLTLYR